MIRIALSAVVLALCPATTLAQPGPHEQESGMPGTMTREALQQAPLRFELDIPYADTDDPRQRLDLYLPEAPNDDRLPVILFFHGGDGRQGGKAAGAERLMPFVASGDYAAVSVGYRPSQEARWPARLHDGKAAIRWVKANADDHGLDVDRLAVWGRGAGAHLALMLGMTGDVPELEGELGPHDEVASDVAAVVNFFGVTDMRAFVEQSSGDDRSTPGGAQALLSGGERFASEEQAVAASPVTYVGGDDPPVLTLHGDEDAVVPYDQAVRLDVALTDAGVGSHFITVPGAGHGGFPPEAEERVAIFLSRVLLGEEGEIPTDPLVTSGE
ncbi:alpha/beta hydrolase fold domain-containing protein [Halomonas sp. C05BenzN]|uniref:alpha/beta hydrolase fold domain-containing protein n=1 Tax=Halomonas sp. C05BenzN TaxID=3411041 RepID=UPI003B944FF6